MLKKQLDFEITLGFELVDGREGTAKIKQKVSPPTEGTEKGSQTETQNKTLLGDTEHYVNDTIMKSAVGSS